MDVRGLRAGLRVLRIVLVLTAFSACAMGETHPESLATESIISTARPTVQPPPTHTPVQNSPESSSFQGLNPTPESIVPSPAPIKATSIPASPTFAPVPQYLEELRGG